jgi:diguanylate cyclase (GGDEF)-like protein
MSRPRTRKILKGLLASALISGPVLALKTDLVWLSLLGVVPPLAALAFGDMSWFASMSVLSMVITVAVGYGFAAADGGANLMGLTSLDLCGLGLIIFAAYRYLAGNEMRLHLQRQTVEDLEDEIARTTEEVVESEKALTRNENKRKRYTRLQEAATQLASTLDLDKLADLILIQTGQILQDKPVSLTLFILDQTFKELLRKEAEHGAGAAYPKEMAADGDPLNQWVISRGTTLIIRDLEKDFRFRGLETSGLKGKCFYISPLLSSQGQVTGLLRVEATVKDSLDTEDQRLMESLVVLASLAAENVKLYRETQELAITDGLTKLLLRRPLIERLEGELRRALQTQTPLSFILLDIDHFKSVNDTYGHPAGDKVLREIAQLVKKRVRDVDLCGRYGGEEFAVLLPATDLKGAKLVGERIREGVRAEPFELRGEHKTITISLGVATCPQDATHVEELIKKADEALYRSKEAGRDRLTAYGEL